MTDKIFIGFLVILVIAMIGSTDEAPDEQDEKTASAAQPDPEDSSPQAVKTGAIEDPVSDLPERYAKADIVFIADAYFKNKVVYKPFAEWYQLVKNNPDFKEVSAEKH